MGLLVGGGATKAVAGIRCISLLAVGCILKKKTYLIGLHHKGGEQKLLFCPRRTYGNQATEGEGFNRPVLSRPAALSLPGRGGGIKIYRNGVIRHSEHVTRVDLQALGPSRPGVLSADRERLDDWFERVKCGDDMLKLLMPLLLLAFPALVLVRTKVELSRGSSSPEGDDGDGDDGVRYAHCDFGSDRRATLRDCMGRVLETAVGLCWTNIKAGGLADGPQATNLTATEEERQADSASFPFGRG